MRTQDNDEPVIEPTPARRPGEELSRAREAAGIELRAMADTLHLPENQVRAIENDDYDRLPPPTFVRGYLRSYARVVGLDDDDIVAAYEALGAAADDPKIHLSGGQDATAHRRGLAMALSVLVLAVAVSVGAWWWQSRATGQPDDPAPPAADAERAAEEPAAEDQSSVQATAGADAADGGHRNAEADAGTEPSAAAEEPASAEDERVDTGVTQSAEPDAPALAELDEGPGTAGGAASELGFEPTPGGQAASDARTVGLDSQTDASDSAEANESASTTESDEPTAVQADAGATAATADSANGDAARESTAAGDTTTASAADADSYEPPAQTASASRASSPLAAEGPEVLKLDFDGRSWIEIYDARGRELVYTLYTGSEPLELRGWAPFDVFLGNSPAVSVEFNGDAVEKSVYTRSDNTARFLVDTEGARRR